MSIDLGETSMEPEKLISTEVSLPEESSDSILEKYRSPNKRDRERVNTLVNVNAHVNAHGDNAVSPERS